MRSHSRDRTTWTYDNAYQLRSERRSGAHAFVSTFVYDAVGNRTRLEEGSTLTSSTYDAANRLHWSDDGSGRTTYTFDAAGNQRTVEVPIGDITTYSWTYENQLAQVEQPDGALTTYVYAPVTKTADEFRVETESDAGTLRQFWDKHNIVLEKDGTGAVEAEYTLDPQPYGNLLSQRRDGESSFYHYDALGSTAALTDDSQTETDSYFYKAFGQLLATTGTTDNPFTWVGQLGYYRDENTGLYSLRAREYGPAVGRFVSEDALRFIIGDENLYQYVANNPANLGDPSGNQPISVLPLNGPTQREVDQRIPCARGCSIPDNASVGSLEDLRELFELSSEAAELCQCANSPIPSVPQKGSSPTCQLPDEPLGPACEQPAPQQCMSMPELAGPLGKKHAAPLLEALKRGLWDDQAKMSDVLTPLKALIQDMLDALDEAEDCNAMSADNLALARQSLNTALKLINAMLAGPDLPMPLVLDIFQMLLGLLGLIPGFGEALDIIDAAISAIRFDIFGAVLGAACAIPGLGNIIGVVRIGKRAPRVIAALGQVPRGAGNRSHPAQQ